MKKNTKNGGLSALQLALIITGSIVAAAGIILIIAKLLKNKKRVALDECCCDCGCDCDEEWFDDDEDYLGDLRFDDDEDCCCGCETEDEIAAAVDEAIEAIEAVTEEE